MDGLDGATLLDGDRLRPLLMAAADRATGVGFDQAMVMLRSEMEGCAAKVRIFNGKDGNGIAHA